MKEWIYVSELKPGDRTKAYTVIGKVTKVNEEWFVPVRYSDGGQSIRVFGEDVALDVLPAKDLD